MARSNPPQVNASRPRRYGGRLWPALPHASLSDPALPCRGLLGAAGLRATVLSAAVLSMAVPALLYPTAMIQAAEPRYAAMDKHALAAPRNAERSLDSLAAYLVKPARNDAEKARAIFRWITANVDYDAKAFFSGSYRNTTVSEDDVLRSRKGVCDGYATIFNALSKRAGLEVVKLPGYAKGFGYDVGQALDGPTNHAWNAVRIDGQWRLVDSTWAAGYLSGEDRRFHRKFQPHYFLTEPSAFLINHLPEEPRWQLVERPISKPEYAKLAYLRPAFFTTGLALESHTTTTIEAGRDLTVTLRNPNGAQMSGHLLRGDTQIKGEHVLIQPADKSRLAIHVRFPRAGDYVLRLFTKQAEAEGSYDWALDYRIKARAAHPVPTFPLTYQEFAGRGVTLHKPLGGRLSRGSHSFRITVPGAQEVTVISGKQWQALDAKGGGVFEGAAVVGGSKTGIYAKFPGQGQYTGLVGYEVR